MIFFSHDRLNADQMLIEAAFLLDLRQNSKSRKFIPLLSFYEIHVTRNSREASPKISLLDLCDSSSLSRLRITFKSIGMCFRALGHFIRFVHFV